MLPRPLLQSPVFLPRPPGQALLRGRSQPRGVAGGGHPSPWVSSYSTHGQGVGFCWETHCLKGLCFLLETVCCQPSSQWFVGDLLPAFLEAFRIFFFLLFRNFTNLGGALFYICCSIFFPVSPAPGIISGFPDYVFLLCSLVLKFMLAGPPGLRSEVLRFLPCLPVHFVFSSSETFWEILKIVS